MTYKIFISHDMEADGGYAHRLATDLQARGLDVWIAPESIRPGESWVASIERGLSESDYVLTLLSPASVGSRWVTQEMEVAIMLEKEGSLRVVPLLLEECNIPNLWRTYQMIDFRKGYGNALEQLLQVLGVSTAEMSELLSPVYSPTKSYILARERVVQRIASPADVAEALHFMEFNADFGDRELWRTYLLSLASPDAAVGLSNKFEGLISHWEGQEPPELWCDCPEWLFSYLPPDFVAQAARMLIYRGDSSLDGCFGALETLKQLDMLPVKGLTAYLGGCFKEIADLELIEDGDVDTNRGRQVLLFALFDREDIWQEEDLLPDLVIQGIAPEVIDSIIVSAASSPELILQIEAYSRISTFEQFAELWDKQLSGYFLDFPDYDFYKERITDEIAVERQASTLAIHKPRSEVIRFVVQKISDPDSRNAKMIFDCLDTLLESGDADLVAGLCDELVRLMPEFDVQLMARALRILGEVGKEAHLPVIESLLSRRETVRDFRGRMISLGALAHKTMESIRSGPHYDFG